MIKLWRGIVDKTAAARRLTMRLFAIVAAVSEHTRGFLIGFIGVVGGVLIALAIAARLIYPAKLLGAICPVVGTKEPALFLALGIMFGLLASAWRKLARVEDQADLQEAVSLLRKVSKLTLLSDEQLDQLSRQCWALADVLGQERTPPCLPLIAHKVVGQEPTFRLIVGLALSEELSLHLPLRAYTSSALRFSAANELTRLAISAEQMRSTLYGYQPPDAD